MFRLTGAPLLAYELASRGGPVNAVPRLIVHSSIICSRTSQCQLSLHLLFIGHSSSKLKHHQTRLVINGNKNLVNSLLPNQALRFITINPDSRCRRIDQSGTIISHFLICTSRTELSPSMGRHPLPVEERKARNAARQRRWRAKRKASRTKPQLKKRVGLLNVLQASIQRRLPTVLLRAGYTLSQSGTSMIRNLSSWLPKLRQHPNKPRASRAKIITSNL